MNPSDKKNKIEQEILNAGSFFKPKPDFEKWSKENPQAVKALKSHADNTPIEKQTQFWRIIMKNPITKLAAAAVIILAIFITITNLPIGTSVAWATLAEKIENAQNVVFHMTANVKMQDVPQGQMPKIKSIAYYSSEYGSRSEQYMNDKLSFTMFLNPKENLYVTVIPEERKFLKVIDKTQAELKQISDKDDPRVMVRRMMAEEYIHLGRDKINGIDVEGIECSNPKVTGGMFEEATVQLWIERGTDYPVRIEIEGIVSGGQMEMSMVMEDFQWDVDLEPALFVPNIPSDYTSQELTVTANEETAIKGLQLFAEFTDGLYPESLVFMTLIKEATEALMKKYGLEITKNMDDYQNKLQIILKAGIFYNQLATADKDAAYYGDTVTADDSGNVLLRWKDSDGTYRVIFADLSAGNFSAEELAEFEK